ncbi:MAG: hypothetical protein AAF465_14670 [Pseudomonadota bacterium]
MLALIQKRFSLTFLSRFLTRIFKRASDGVEALPSRPQNVTYPVFTEATCAMSLRKDSTEPSKGADGYGYFGYLSGDGAVSASGIVGRAISIDRANNVIVALPSARPVASSHSDGVSPNALYEAITRAIA